MFHRIAVNNGNVDYVNAHGRLTNANDKFETIAMQKLFNENVKKLERSSTTSIREYLLRAAGAVGAILCAKPTETGIISPLIHVRSLIQTVVWIIFPTRSSTKCE
jgi:3-oxoacyl-[acyl-carrier-protein] synthase II